MRRTGNGRQVVRLAAGPLAAVTTRTVEPNPPSFRPVLFSPPLSHSAIGSHTTDAARAVDVWLDYFDAANELPDGSLEAA